jgi:REP element-mobilizing transposase RayT
MFVVLSNHVHLVKILKEKSKVFSFFKKFKALVKKESDYSIKSLRMDRG